MAKNKRGPAILFLGSLIGFNLLVWLAVYDLSRQQLEVNFFDVGQGDAIFIVSPQKHQILIDGGPGAAILEKLAKNMPFWDRTIDLMILTHPESDHLAGLIEVLKRYKVENILWTGVVRNTFEYQEWLKLIREEGANVFEAKEGMKIKGSKAVLEVLYPFENLAGKEFENSNDTSIVSRLTFGQNSFLFTGDISQSAEKELAASKDNIESSVLKVSHHGSKTSTAEDFLKKVSPEIAVISAGGNNRYGHPHQEVLDILENYGIKILRTDLKGDVKIVGSGNIYQIK